MNQGKKGNRGGNYKPQEVVYVAKNQNQNSEKDQISATQDKDYQDSEERNYAKNNRGNQNKYRNDNSYNNSNNNYKTNYQQKQQQFHSDNNNNQYNEKNQNQKQLRYDQNDQYQHEQDLYVVKQEQKQNSSQNEQQEQKQQSQYKSKQYDQYEQKDYQQSNKSQQNNNNSYYNNNNKTNDYNQSKSFQKQKKPNNSENQQKQQFDVGGYQDENNEQNNNNINNSYKQKKNSNYQSQNQSQNQYSKNTRDDDNYENTDSQLLYQYQSKDIVKGSQTEILINGFFNRKIECSICCKKVLNEQSIWNCIQCYTPFHLPCMKTWINKSNTPKESQQQQKDKKEEKQIFNWSCPNCQYQYTNKMPNYTCFCQKQQNPEYDYAILPHSCGEICDNKRGINCQHLCDLPCHPGACPPCQKLGPKITCYCTKSQKQIMCSDNYNQFICDQACGKQLNCKIHYCQKKCHSGKCQDCTEKVNSSCYCSKTEKEVFCGQTKFSCQHICEKSLDCKNHQCKYKCHPGPCRECTLKPQLVKKCPCNQFDLATLGGQPRKSCLDQIICCGLPCKKQLPCGIHYCKNSCHIGPCDKCQVEVKESCQCSSSDRKIPCWVNNEEQKEKFICDKICKKKLSCKVHQCGKQCCPIKSSEDPQGVHLCLKVCDKQLNCGNHKCELFCHLGKCEKCPIYVNQVLTCVCGKSKIQPPYQCGTQPPECSYPCSRIKACMHPCHIHCHQDQCPPCEYGVDKTCRCGKKIIQNVACSKEALCLDPCTKVMNCGHVCGENCHLGNCPKDSAKGCGKKCGKIRTSCKHQCLAFCHPNNACPNEVCKVEVKVECQCGQRKTFVECGSTDSDIKRTLPCNNVCQNYKRFSSFYSTNKSKQPYYPPQLHKFAKNNLAYLQKLEGKIEQMVKQSQESIEMPFINDTQKKSAVQILLERHYNLETQYYVNFKNPFFVIRTTQNMIIPKMLLSEYSKKVDKGEIKPEVLPFDVSVKFGQLGRGDTPSYLDTLLKDFKGQYYLEKQDKEKLLIAHFWELDQGEAAILKLKKSQSSFNNFTIDYNQKLIAEKIKENDPLMSQEVIREQIIQKKKSESKKQNPLDSPQMKNLVQKYFSSTVDPQEEILELRNKYEEKARCTEMCSEEEIEERDKSMNIALFEQDPRKSEYKFFKPFAIKSFLRQNVDNQSSPDSVRTIDCLFNTTQYIIREIIDIDIQIETIFKLPYDQKGKKRLHNFDDIYQFALDKFKAIRQDITLYGEVYEKKIVEILEIITRFLILSIPQILSREIVDKNLERINRNEYETTLSMLKKQYSQLKDCVNEGEFYAYLVLIQCDNEFNLQSLIQNIRFELFENPKLSKAMELIRIIKANDYINFFKMLKEEELLLSCVMNIYVNKMRFNGTILLMKSKYDITLNEYCEQFLLDSKENALKFLKGFGIDTQNLTKPDEYETDTDEEEEEKQQDITKLNSDEQYISSKESSYQQQDQNQKENNQYEQKDEKSEQLDKEKEQEKFEENEESEGEQDEKPLIQIEQQQETDLNQKKKLKLKIQYINWKSGNYKSKVQDDQIVMQICNKKSSENYPKFDHQNLFMNEKQVSKYYIIYGQFENESKDKEDEIKLQESAEQQQEQENQSQLQAKEENQNQSKIIENQIQ